MVRLPVRYSLTVLAEYDLCVPWQEIPNWNAMRDGQCDVVGCGQGTVFGWALAIYQDPPWMRVQRDLHMLRG